MLVEKYNIKHKYLGIIYYLKLNQLQFINLKLNEINDIVFKRN